MRALPGVSLAYLDEIDLGKITPLGGTILLTDGSGAFSVLAAFGSVLASATAAGLTGGGGGRGRVGRAAICFAEGVPVHAVESARRLGGFVERAALGHRDGLRRHGAEQGENGCRSKCGETDRRHDCLRAEDAFWHGRRWACPSVLAPDHRSAS